MRRGPCTLLLGHFGSGKTEVAIQLALRHNARDGRTVLVDLDFITPYYRSRDVADELEGLGIEVVAPERHIRQSDMPVVTARAVQALLHHDGPVVADVGGDEGARVIGGLAGSLRPGDYEALMVVNPYRPGTGTPEQVAAYARWLEEVARLRLTGLVNNANVGWLTRPHHVLRGLELVRRAGALLGLPVAFSAVRRDLAGELQGIVSDGQPPGGSPVGDGQVPGGKPTDAQGQPKHPLLALDLRMRPPWEAPALDAR